MSKFPKFQVEKAEFPLPNAILISVFPTLFSSISVFPTIILAISAFRNTLRPPLFRERSIITLRWGREDLSYFSWRSVMKMKGEVGYLSNDRSVMLKIFEVAFLSLVTCYLLVLKDETLVLDNRYPVWTNHRFSLLLLLLLFYERNS